MSVNHIKYDWNFNQKPFIGLPMSNMPRLPCPTDSWILKVIKKLNNVFDNVQQYLNLSFYDEVQRNEIKTLNNRALILENEYEEVSLNREAQSRESDEVRFTQFIALVNDFSKFILGLTNPGSLRTLGDKSNVKVTEWGLDRYNSIFQNEPLPAVAHYLRDDAVFAYWRVAGNNPVMIKNVTELPAHFPLKNTQYQEVMGSADNLSKAISEHRLYLVDYKNIGEMVNEEGSYKEKSGVTYAYAPIALFAIPAGTRHLIPVAIQTGQDPALHNIFLKSEKRDYYWGWQMAKYLVQVAEESYHELFTHLAFTHLISEVFAVAIVRNFNRQHVLYKLLKTHFEGTTFINNGAVTGLINENQFIDSLFSAEIGKIQQETLIKRFNYDFFDMMLPKDLERRGVNDASTLGEYPYRDDGLLIWHAIADWVSDYVDLYYYTDNHVVLDTDLNKWVDDIIANGKIYGFRKITTCDTLKEVLTMIIFTASAQHAAVNFTQPEWQRYAPAMSGTSATKAPYSRTGRDNQDWLSMLANYDQALQKYVIYSVLGGVYHGYLGKYREVYNDSQSVFDDQRVTAQEGILDKFRKNLRDIEATINARNAERPLPYTALLPTRIPASTNI